MQLILGIVLTVLVFLILRHWADLAPGKKKATTWKAGLLVLGLILAFLVLTGRMHVLVAAVAALLPLVKKLPALMRYLPFLRRLHENYRGAGSAEAETGGPQGRHVAAAAMSASEACEILGVVPGCTDEEVVLAHRRLMQKMHPDRGGTDYLAARINEARNTLLGGRRR
ncbi:J domain-containing protein [Marinobacter sp.]|uniref:J domain-containing protein n=1 Tax=Marinobacter sp. TaxID=50741 RepID=UPI00384DEB0D